MNKILKFSILLWGIIFFVNTDNDFNEGYAREYNSTNLQENISTLKKYPYDIEKKFTWAIKNNEYKYWKTVIAKVTAYEPSYVSCGRFADGKTSISDNAYVLDGCAVDPSAIPYRSLIYIPGVGFKEADDTGMAMKKSWRSGVYHIDVRFLKVSEADKWGVKFLKVDIYLPVNQEKVIIQ